MRTADDPIHHDYGLDRMRLDECKDLRSDSFVKAHVSRLGEKPAHDLRFTRFGKNHRNRDLRSKIRRGSIKSDGGDRITVKSTLGSFFELIARLVQNNSRFRTMR